jgi:phosphonate transport system ATP-binding protein
MELLAALHTGRGCTVVVSLHQVEFALRYCPRTVALHYGRVVYDGPSAALTPQRLCELYGSDVEDLFEGSLGVPPQHQPRMFPPMAIADT